MGALTKPEQFLVDWWNARAGEIESLIWTSADPKDTVFYWSQLVWQELDMWRMMGEVVSKDDLNFIVDRRGFTDRQKHFLVEGLTHLGLGPVETVDVNSLSVITLRGVPQTTVEDRDYIERVIQLWQKGSIDAECLAQCIVERGIAQVPEGDGNVVNRVRKQT